MDIISRDSKWWVRVSNRFAIIAQNSKNDIGGPDYMALVKARAAATVAKALQSEGK